MRNPTSFVMGVALVLSPGCAGPEPAAADYVMTNGKIYTVDENQPSAEAVGVNGTDIVYVGDDNGAREFIGDNTTVTDLEGKLMDQ